MRPLHVVIRVLQQPQNDVLHVLAHIAGFGERGRIGHGKRHVQNPGQRPREQRLARAGRADHQDVALLDFHVRVGAGGRRFVRFFPFGGRRLLLDALVVVVHRHGERLLRVVLSNTIQVELTFDFRRPGHGELWLMFAALKLEFAVEDVLAEDDAVVANVNTRSGDELFDFGVRLAAEAAHGDVGGPGQGNC